MTRSRFWNKLKIEETYDTLRPITTLMWINLLKFKGWWKHQPQKPGFPRKKPLFSVFSYSERKCLDVLILHGKVSVASGLKRIDHSSPVLLDPGVHWLFYTVVGGLQELKTCQMDRLTRLKTRLLKEQTRGDVSCTSPPHSHPHPRVVYLFSSVRSVPLCVFEKAPQGHSNLQTFKV